MREFVLYILNYKNLSKQLKVYYLEKSFILDFNFLDFFKNLKNLDSAYFLDKSVHFVVNKIRLWKTNLDFFVLNKLNRFFGIRNKNKLKKIFLKIIEDHSVWNEMEKMFSANVINLSSMSIYEDDNFFNFSPLSRFLLEIYLVELVCCI